MAARVASDRLHGTTAKRISGDHGDEVGVHAKSSWRDADASVVKKAARSDMQDVRNIRRASPKEAWDLSATSEGRDAMLSEFDRDIYSAGAQSVRDAQLNTWEAIHSRWAPDLPVLPLTWGKIRNVGAHMKRAGYRSWGNYASRIKDSHVDAGHPWTLQLEVAMRRAKRSVLRGIGPAMQAISLCLLAVHRLDPDGLLLTPAMPVGGVHAFIVACFILLREIEMARIRHGDVDLDEHEQTVTLSLSISKNDPEARDCERKWGVSM